MNTIKFIRITNETKILLKININNNNIKKISTPISFFNHMLNLFFFFLNININIKANGDIKVDKHHLIEDIGIVLGLVFFKIFYKINKIKLIRYNNIYIPLDESLTRIVIDIGGRSKLVYKILFNDNKIIDFDLNLIKEFFISFVNNSKITLHIDNIRGENNHHQCETIFKAMGILLNNSLNIKKINKILSTKGIL